jgi:selenocysteine-specific elongation factor
MDSVSRLPVDRAFTIKGFGAVITGTLVTGEIVEGAELQLLPSTTRVRARGLQVHGTTVAHATAGQRTAINLGGVDVAMIDRGMVLAPVARLRATQIIDTHVTVLKNAARALRSRARVRIHIHGAEVLARVQVLTAGAQLAPGESGFVQLRLESPVVAVAGERFIIRSYSPSQTAGGGLILDPFAIKHRGRDLAGIRQRLERLKGANASDRVSIFVESSGDLGQRFADLAARTGWNDETLMQALTLAKQGGTVIDCEGVFVSTQTFQLLKQAAVDEVSEHHRKEPLGRGAARETLRERRFAHTPPEVFRAVLGALELEGELISDRDVVRARTHTVELSNDDAGLKDRLAKVYEQAHLEPPTADEAMQAAGVSSAQRNHGRKVLQLLIDGHIVVRVQGELFFHRDALNRLIARLKEFADQQEPDRTIDVAKFKELAGVSRKYAIPLLEFLDRERITKRAGDRRAILK